jgi:hypothetical protein
MCGPRKSRIDGYDRLTLRVAGGRPLWAAARARATACSNRSKPVLENRYDSRSSATAGSTVEPALNRLASPSDGKSDASHRLLMAKPLSLRSCSFDMMNFVRHVAWTEECAQATCAGVRQTPDR